MKAKACGLFAAFICVLVSLQVILWMLEGEFTYAPFLIYSTWGAITAFKCVVKCCMEEQEGREAK